MSSYISPGTGIPVNSTTVLDTSRDTSAASIVPNIAYFQHGTSAGSPVNASGSVELIPHRIFVGGFPSATMEHELRTFFEAYGRIREVKIIRSPDGSPKGYGFVTFDTEEEAQAVRKQCEDGMEFKGRRLNVGPAMRRISQNARISDLAVAAPTVMVSGGYPPSAFVVPEGYFLTQPTQGPATYAVMVPGQPAYAQLAPYPSSLAYSPGQVTSHQPRFIVPVANSHLVNGLQSAQPASPEKTSASSAVTPARPQNSNSGNGVHSSPQSTPHSSTTPTRLQHGYGNTNTSGTLYNQTGYGYSQPLTPITPGMAQQSGFRWPAGVQVQQTAPYSQIYPQTAVYPGSNAYYPVTDMTHYSQMYSSGQVQQQTDYYSYHDVYATPVENSNKIGMYVPNEVGGSFFQAVAAMAGSRRSTTRVSDEDSVDTIAAISPRSHLESPQSGNRWRYGRKKGSGFPADPVTPEKKLSSTSPTNASETLASGDGTRHFRYFKGRKVRHSVSLPNSPGECVARENGIYKHADNKGNSANSKPQSPHQRNNAGRSPRKSVVSLTNQMNQLAINGTGNNDLGI